MKKAFLTILMLLSFSVFAYDFTFEDKKINFNQEEFKFYQNSNLLTKGEVAKIFPEYEIITISQFDKNRKFYLKNKAFNSKKVLILNDRNRTFPNYNIYPISARDNENIKSLITIYGKKDIRILHPSGDKFEIIVK